MNYYFLLEDEKSFIKVLPHWLKYMGFNNERVADIKYISKNNYVMQSGQGVTQLITNILYKTIDTIYENKGKVDELIVILDSEEYDSKFRIDQVNEIIEQYKNEKTINEEFSYRVFACNHCFETWLLGNETLYPNAEPNFESDFNKYYNHYNIKSDDPENLLPPKESEETIATYHFHYFHEACRYNKIRYCKKRPENVAKIEYFEAIVNRIKTTKHLKSFEDFYKYFSELKQ